MNNDLKSFVRVPKRDVVLGNYYCLFCKDKFINFYFNKIVAYEQIKSIIFSDNNFTINDFKLFKVQPIKI